jgi:hypothetical protein
MKYAHERELDPQYDLKTFQRKFGLSEEEARAFLEIAGSDRQVAESLARIDLTSRASHRTQRVTRNDVKSSSK